MQPGDPQNPGYGSFGAPPPAKKGGGLKIVLIVLGVVGLLGVLSVVACCGGGYLFGTKALGEKLKVDLGSNAEMQKHIGTIQSADFDAMATGRHAQENPQDQSKAIVFNVKGDKGEGVVTMRYSDDQQSIMWAKLRTSSGEDVALVGSP